MKQIIALLLLLIQYNSWACDFCGSFNSMAFSNSSAVDFKSSISTTYLLRPIHYISSQTAIENSNFHTFQLNGAYAVKKFSTISVSLPFMLVQNKSNGYNTTQFSIADMQLNNNYAVYNKARIDTMSNKVISHKFNLGWGLELPTGKQAAISNELSSINFGSQSVDFLFTALHQWQKSRWTIMQLAQAKINTYNSNHYKLGNYYWYQATATHTTFLKQAVLVPLLGVKQEIANKNLHHAILQEKSGFWLLSALIGIEWSKNNYHLGLIAQQPLVQNSVQKTIKQQTNLNLYFNYQFKK